MRRSRKRQTSEVPPYWKIDALPSDPIVQFFTNKIPEYRADAAIIKFRDAYLTIAKKYKVGRDGLVHETHLMEEVKQEFGHEVAHLRTDELRSIIVSIHKSDGGGKIYGGSWRGGLRKKAIRGPMTRQQKKTMREMQKQHNDYLERLRARPDWPALRATRFSMDNHRCRLCNADKNLVCHHRTYATWETPYEIDDLTTLCQDCHNLFHGNTC